MIVNQLTLENFKQYRQLQLDFQEGLVGIIGKNGSGKSSIFEGLLLCLFGSINTDKSQYKTSWAGKKDNIFLELKFEVQQKVYRVVREFRGKALAPQANIYDHEETLIATGAKAVNAFVEDLLGMDKNAFTHSIFSGQKELSLLSSATKEDRKKLVRRMIGLDNLDQIQKLIREDKNGLKNEIQGQSNLLLSKEDLQQLTKELKTLEQSIKQQSKILEKTNKKLLKQNESYQKAKTDFATQLRYFQSYSDIETKLEKYKALLEGVQQEERTTKKQLEELNVLQKKQLTLSKPVAAHRQQLKKLEALNQDREKFQQQQNLLNKQKTYEESLAEIIVKQKELSPIIKLKTAKEKEIKTMEEQLEQEKSQIAKVEKRLLDLNNEVGKVQGKINDRQQQLNTISNLGKDAACPTCLQPLVEFYQQTLEQLSLEINGYQNKELKICKEKINGVKEKKIISSNKIQTLEVHLKTLQGQLQTVLVQSKELENLTERHQKGVVLIKTLAKDIKSIGKVNFDQKEYETLVTETKKFESVFLQYQIDADKLSRIPELKEQLSNIKERIKKGKEKIITEEKALKGTKYSADKYQATHAKQDSSETERDETQQLLKKLNQDNQQLINQQTSGVQQLQNHERVLATIADNQKAFEELETLDGLFKSFKTYILDRIKPTITEYAGDLFQRITKGRYESIEVDDNFEFHIYENGIPYPISRFSGGEIDLANLCLRIGISKAIAELSGSTESLTFLGFDEIFGSQDEDRRMEIMLALEHLKEQYRQIYIITHVDTVKDYFPNILQVTKTADGSTAFFQ